MQNIEFQEKMWNGIWNTAQGKIHLWHYTQLDSLIDEYDSKQEMSGNFFKVFILLVSFLKTKSNASGEGFSNFQKAQELPQNSGCQERWHEVPYWRSKKYFGTTRPHSVTRATTSPCFVHPCLRLWYRVTDIKDRTPSSKFSFPLHKDAQVPPQNKYTAPSI
jgi:hypothetical protein